MQIDELKKLHDYHATVCQILTQRVQFYVEEFEGVQNLVQFYSKMCAELKIKIEAAEKEQSNVKEESTDGTPV